MEALQNYVPVQTTKLISADGKAIRDLYVEKREVKLAPPRKPPPPLPITPTNESMNPNRHTQRNIFDLSLIFLIFKEGFSIYGR